MTQIYPKINKKDRKKFDKIIKEDRKNMKLKGFVFSSFIKTVNQSNKIKMKQVYP